MFQQVIADLLAWILQGIIMGCSSLQFHISWHVTSCYFVSACILQWSLHHIHSHLETILILWSEQIEWLLQPKGKGWLVRAVSPPCYAYIWLADNIWLVWCWEVSDLKRYLTERSVYLAESWDVVWAIGIYIRLTGCIYCMTWWLRVSWASKEVNLLPSLLKKKRVSRWLETVSSTFQDRVWWVIITTLYLLTPTSWYQQTVQSSGNNVAL